MRPSWRASRISCSSSSNTRFSNFFSSNSSPLVLLVSHSDQGSLESLPILGLLDSASVRELLFRFIDFRIHPNCMFTDLGDGTLLVTSIHSCLHSLKFGLGGQEVQAFQKTCPKLQLTQGSPMRSAPTITKDLQRIAVVSGSAGPETRRPSGWAPSRARK